MSFVNPSSHTSTSGISNQGVKKMHNIDWSVVYGWMQKIIMGIFGKTAAAVNGKTLIRVLPMGSSPECASRFQFCGGGLGQDSGQWSWLEGCLMGVLMVMREWRVHSVFSVETNELEFVIFIRENMYGSMWEFAVMTDEKPIHPACSASDLLALEGFFE